MPPTFVLLVAVSILPPYLSSLEYPPGWDSAPGSLEDFKAGENYVIDPWRYHQRLGAYKVILNQTSFAMSSFGSNNSGNILWGLPLQFGWQFASQRCRDLSNVSTCGYAPNQYCVSPRNWWASMNYYLSVVPFLGMVKAGYFDVDPAFIQIKRSAEDPTMYCCNITECDDIEPLLVSRWSDLFLLLKNESLRQAMRPEKLKDLYLSTMWEAHLQSIEVGLRLFQVRLNFMSGVESEFGRSWANLVTFIAATRFPTDNKNTVENQVQYLPKRLLWDSDNPPNAPGLTKDENRALVVLKLCDRLNYYSGGTLLAFWQRAMCTPEGREIGRHILLNIVTHLWTVFKEIIKLIFLVFTKPC